MDWRARQLWVPVMLTGLWLLLSPAVVEGQSPKKKQNFKIYHVNVFDDGKTSPKPPKELKRFERTLRRIGSRWELASKPVVISMEAGGKKTIKLPRRLGTAKLQMTLDPKTKGPVLAVTVTPLKPKNKKDHVFQKSAKYPVILGWDRLKVGPNQYTLIIETTKEKPTPKPKK